jgi:endonuclease YncB( thermonuclease family)
MKVKKNLLLWNYWANLNQTLLKRFLDGPLPKLCPVTPTSSQAGRQAKNRKKGGWNLKNLLLWNYWANLNQTLLKWFLDGPLPKLCPVTPTSNQAGRQAKNRKKGGWNLKNLLLWNYWANLNQTLLKWSLGGSLPNLCLTFQTSDQDCHHSRT